MLLVDMRSEPMSRTSAQSCENYRNCWPHPAVTAFTNRSIDLMEVIANYDNNCIHLTRRGYVLATRSESKLDEIVNGMTSAPSNEENRTKRSLPLYPRLISKLHIR